LFRASLIATEILIFDQIRLTPMPNCYWPRRQTKSGSGCKERSRTTAPNGSRMDISRKARRVQIVAFKRSKTVETTTFIDAGMVPTI
jgi:hypothetical protein